LNPSSQLNLRL